MKLRVVSSWTGDYFFVEKKDWLVGWDRYDNLSFKTYDSAMKHLANIKLYS